jgi:hypothetical protein
MMKLHGHQPTFDDLVDDLLREVIDSAKESLLIPTFEEAPQTAPDGDNVTRLPQRRETDKEFKH